MAIRSYSVVSGHGGAVAYEANLCGYHANIKRVFSKSVEEIGEASPEAKCEDCRPPEGPTVLDRIVEESEAKERAAEPAPPKVLPGQRRLF